jgi:hypothetical protein
MGETTLTLEQRIHNALGSQELERKKAIHSYVHAVNYENEEFDRLWVKSENATWGHNFGRMVGFEMIYYNHILGEMQSAATNHFRICRAHPEMRYTDVRSGGAGNLHALSEGCVEVAEDGQSARGWFLTPGTMLGVFGRGERRNAGALWEYYGCDFVFHDGQWLYLHEHVCPVMSCGYDEKNWAHDLYAQADDDPSHTLWRGIPCEVGDPGPLSERYNVHQTVQHLLWECPEPYKALDEDHTYSPGHNDPTVLPKPFLKAPEPEPGPKH